MAYVNPYTKTLWVDEVDEFEGRFKETELGGGVVEHEIIRGEVYTEGTPQDAQHFNHMEQGIFDAHEELVQQDGRTGNLEAQTLPEVQEVTRTNSDEFPFNNSAVSVSLQTVRDNLNYVVEIISVVAEGDVGEVEITDRQTNGFKIGYTGSAASAVIKFAVIGGFDQ